MYYERLRQLVTGVFEQAIALKLINAPLNNIKLTELNVALFDRFGVMFFTTDGSSRFASKLQLHLVASSGGKEVDDPVKTRMWLFQIINELPQDKLTRLNEQFEVIVKHDLDAEDAASVTYDHVQHHAQDHYDDADAAAPQLKYGRGGALGFFLQHRIPGVKIPGCDAVFVVSDHDGADEDELAEQVPLASVSSTHFIPQPPTRSNEGDTAKNLPRSSAFRRFRCK